MGLITLDADRLRLSIDPDLGAGIADFSLLGPSKFYYPLMRRAAADETNPSSLSSFFMAPWCNRIAGARFVFAGRERVLKATNPDGVAQHGDVRRRPWTVLDRSPRSASLELDSRTCDNVNWPWAYLCRCRYELTPTTLDLELSVKNIDSEAFPAGCGHHPYFVRRLWNDHDALQVRAHVSGRYPLAKGVATGPAVEDHLTRHLRELRTVPDEHIDTVFAGFGGQAELHWPASKVTLRMKASANLGHLVLFTPHVETAASSPLSFVAVEPQSQVNGALNLPDQAGVGTVVLQPGETLATLCRFEIAA